MTTNTAKLLFGVSSLFGFPGETIVYTGTDVSRIKTGESKNWNIECKKNVPGRENIQCIKEMDRMNIEILDISELEGQI